MPAKKLVTAFEGRSHIDAMLVKNFLEGEGLHAKVPGEEGGEDEPMGDGWRLTEVRVPVSEKARAIELIREWYESAADAELEDFDEDSDWGEDEYIDDLLA